MKNIGPGLAVSTVWIEDLAAKDPEVLHLGGIEPGGDVRLPQELVNRLNDEARKPLDRTRHVILSEPLTGELWTVTRNLMESTGRLSHQIGTLVIPLHRRQQIHRETFEEYVHKHWAEIQQDLNAMLKSLGGDAVRERPASQDKA